MQAILLLRGLPRLEELHVGGNNITDLSFNSTLCLQLTNLKAGLSPISGCPAFVVCFLIVHGKAHFERKVPAEAQLNSHQQSQKKLAR